MGVWVLATETLDATAVPIVEAGCLGGRDGSGPGRAIGEDLGHDRGGASVDWPPTAWRKEPIEFTGDGGEVCPIHRLGDPPIDVVAEHLMPELEEILDRCAHGFATPSLDLDADTMKP